MAAAFLAGVSGERRESSRPPAIVGETAASTPEVGAPLLEDAHVFGSFTLGTLSLVVLNGLAFMEAFVGDALDGGRVEEDVSPLALDEAEALVS
jgi:hypothetical protein